MEIKTLSSFPGCPFNDTFETFFDTYQLGEDVECYQLLFCPYGTGSSFEDLYKINFQSKVVILNIMDLMINIDDNTAIDKLEQFCNDHPEQNFIIFNFHLNLKKELSLSNLYTDTILTTNLTEKLKPCEKKDISNRWLVLNADTKVHKVMSVAYLLSKDYCDNGDITFSMHFPTLVKYDKYRNMTKIPEHLREDFSRGYEKFKSKDFNLLKIRNFDSKNDRVAKNYNTNLMPVYQNIGVEIINGTMFFEKTPVLSEKEVQSIFAKNFPIYINAPGMSQQIKRLFGIDIFDDIVDHSYDDIEDHFERMAAAIDRNEELLNGSTNIKELWYDNQKRFDDNCERMTSLCFDKSYQRIFNHEKIKQSLMSFNISVTEKTKNTI